MPAQPNYTAEMTNLIVDQYTNGVPLEDISQMVTRSVRSVRSKLVREGVYVAATKATVSPRPHGPTKKELLAANKTNNEICEYIAAKSLKFLSIEGLYRAIGFEKRNETYPQLTDHYFTGDYPVKPVDELGDSKITQLSLLSTASNN